jgi:hypothetical protein
MSTVRRSDRPRSPDEVPRETVRSVRVRFDLAPIASPA